MARRRRGGPVTNGPRRHLSYPEALVEDDVAVSGASRRVGGREGLMRASRLPLATLLVGLALATGACSDSPGKQGTQTSSSTTATVPAPSSTGPSPSPSASRDPATAAKAAYKGYVQ